MASHKPRIRSIKPEFWTDEKIAELPKATALFFIALWNFADDQGIIEDSSRGLALRIPIFRSQDIEKMLNALWQAGLIARSVSDGLVLIRGWKHQKIDRPSDGKWKHKKINWLMHCGSTMSSEESSTGSDRIGSDQTGGEGSNYSPPSEIEEHYLSEFLRLRKTQAAFITDEDVAAIKRMLALRGMRPDRLKKLITTFLWMDHEWFDKKGRSLSLLEQNLSKVVERAAPAPDQPRGVA